MLGTVWAARGLFFGFPPCCIHDFILRAGPTEDVRPLDGTGYVPCPACSATYTDEELVARINERRHCSIPFPAMRDEDDAVDQEFANWITAVSQAEVIG